MPVTPETDVPPPQPPPPHNQLSFICIEEEIYEDQSTATGAMNTSEYCGCSIANSLQTTKRYLVQCPQLQNGIFFNKKWPKKANMAIFWPIFTLFLAYFTD